MLPSHVYCVAPSIQWEPACGLKTISSGHPWLWLLFIGDINQMTTVWTSGHLGFPFQNRFSLKLTSRLVAASPRLWTISHCVITGYSGNHVAVFWPWEVSGLLISASVAKSCKDAVLLPCRFLLLSKYWRCLSVFSVEHWKTRWKTEVQVEDNFYLADKGEGMISGVTMKSKTMETKTENKRVYSLIALVVGHIPSLFFSGR